MNVKGVIERIHAQLHSYKAHTTHTPEQDGVALLMSDKTWKHICMQGDPWDSSVNFQKMTIGGCHIIRSPEVPDGQCYVVLPEGHDLIAPLPTSNMVGMDPEPEYVKYDPPGVYLTGASGGSYTFSAGTNTYTYNPIYFDPSPPQGLYQQSPTPTGGKVDGSIKGHDASHLVFDEVPPAKTGTTLAEEVLKKFNELKAQNLVSPTNMPTPIGGTLSDKTKVKLVEEALGVPATKEEMQAKAAEKAAAGVAKAKQFPNPLTDTSPFVFAPKQNGKSTAYQEALQQAIEDTKLTTNTWVPGSPDPLPYGDVVVAPAVQFGEFQIGTSADIPPGHIEIVAPDGKKMLKKKKKKAS